MIDLIPKIYDTERVIRIEAKDGSVMDVTISPDAEQPYQKVNQDNPQTDNSQQIAQIIFNPSVGTYDVQSDTGPSFATRRQEAFNALTQIAAQNKEFMGIAGDILWKVADFPEAQVLAQRWRKIIPPNITGDAPNPQQEQMMHQAADKIEQQLALIAQQQKELADREQEFRIKHLELDLKLKEAMATQSRLDYDAETKRLTSIGNSGPGISVEQIQPLVQQIIRGMLNAGEPGAGELIKNAPGIGEGGTPIALPEAPESGGGPSGNGAVQQDQDSLSGVPGSQLGPDGKHYVKNGAGQYLEVSPANA